MRNTLKRFTTPGDWQLLWSANICKPKESKPRLAALWLWHVCIQDTANHKIKRLTDTPRYLIMPEHLVKETLKDWLFPLQLVWLVKKSLPKIHRSHFQGSHGPRNFWNIMEFNKVFSKHWKSEDFIWYFCPSHGILGFFVLSFLHSKKKIFCSFKLLF